MGVDALLIVPFTHEFSRWTADRFIEEFLVAALKVTEVRIGRDFCFGAGREGNLAKLQAAGERFGFEVHGIDEMRIRGMRVSSSIVRDASRKGAMRMRHHGPRPHLLHRRPRRHRPPLGRKIGFPTVNVDPSNELFPGGGVYVTTSRFESFRRSFESVTNIGVRRRSTRTTPSTIESHILDFDSNVYGDTVRLYFHELLRREQQFRSALELTNQIRDGHRAVAALLSAAWASGGILDDRGVMMTAPVLTFVLIACFFAAARIATSASLRPRNSQTSPVAAVATASSSVSVLGPSTARTVRAMRVPWKLVGLAGVAGVAATGAVVARRRRAQREYDPVELRDRLHRRLAEAAPAAGAAAGPAGAAQPGEAPGDPASITT